MSCLSAVLEKFHEAGVRFQATERKIRVEPGHSLTGVDMKTLGAHCMAEAIERIRDGGFQPIENRTGQGSYFSFPSKQDVRRFRRMGYKLL